MGIRGNFRKSIFKIWQGYFLHTCIIFGLILYMCFKIYLKSDEDLFFGVISKCGPIITNFNRARPWVKQINYIKINRNFISSFLTIGWSWNSLRFYDDMHPSYIFVDENRLYRFKYGYEPHITVFYDFLNAENFSHNFINFHFSTNFWDTWQNI